MGANQGDGLQLYNFQSQGQPKPPALWPWTSWSFSFSWSSTPRPCCASQDHSNLDQTLTVPPHRQRVQGQE